MSNLNMNEIFIRFSSQTFCGIKPANLFTIPSKNFSSRTLEDWKRIAAKQNLVILSFELSSKTMMIFIYDSKWISEILKSLIVRSYLETKGYLNINDTNKTLEKLFSRIKGKENFPHEVGIFLGYPFEDVIKFEEHQGKSCKYCGYWKSYCNPEEAKKCCDRYRHCSQMCTQWFDEGYSIPQIIKKYKEAAAKAA
ncbi:DUF3793 family protein [Treponema sp.]|uniref:DUF3793 family protein n=1 Tax=Treponema sp. TaxID=166 RepID=UPI00298E97E8|nr:DUF3793 family protein [Treponema sp.]MCQ2242398.1 DUF3793 family protein [Treponema sp.]